MTIEPSLRPWLWAWGAQVASTLGSALAAFSLGIWLLQQHGSVTDYAWVIALSALPGLLLAPLAGWLVDRCEARALLLGVEACSGAAALALWWLFESNALDRWQVYAFAAVNSSTLVVRMLVCQAAIPRLLRSPQAIGRANGLMQLMVGLPQLIAPTLAALLLGSVGVPGVLLLDLGAVLSCATVLIWIGLFVSAVRGTGQVRVGAEGGSSVVLAVLRGRPALWALLAYLGLEHLMLGLASALLSPLVLERHSVLVLGTLMTCGGLGMLGGSLWVVARPPVRLIRTVLLADLLLGAAVLTIGASASPVVLYVAAFVAFGCFSLSTSSDQSFWQRSLPADALGRVLSARQMVCLLAMPIGALGAGALADGWAITLMSKTGEWQSRLAPLLGTGKVGGLSLLFAVAGLLYVLLASLGLAFGPLRRLQPGVPLYGETRRGAGLTAAGSGDVLAGAPRLEEQG
ncbi:MULTISPECIES: MFS transporter [Pseudomonas]|jgi:MFS family permease|uniref:MFS transporter n=1 Tax=Pseudomonas TaxID=286 RepID=UPI0009091693|nr:MULTISPECIES: MFS transporter [Pseudomonas]TCV66158.1 MFS transporter [Pseudomonas fluorescens]SFW22688.1 Major Facilitator Superfamily protein [Pseudomonas sp. NFACC04-2]